MTNAIGVKIGIEVHGYLVTKEKLFCRCPTNYKTAKLNTNICPVCTAQPGCKPMLPNVEALRKTIAIALMLDCKISSKQVIWQRKHYDWPDLPKGFQDTTSGAYAVPIGFDGNFLGIRIRHVHIEEDPARWDPSTGRVDYNRCGMPLVEIVTEPEFTSAKHAREWLKQLVITLSYIKALDRDAGIKADINVSVAKGERVEIKNVNSIYNIEKAIDYEILRQRELLKKGEKVARETRAFSEHQRITIAMRAKEFVEDYRYIPEPDLSVIEIPKQLTKKIQSFLPESPNLKVQRFIKQYKIKTDEATVLSSNLELANFFEDVARKIPKLAKLASTWVTIELLRILNYNRMQLHQVNIKPGHFAELLQLVDEGKITELAAKRILNRFIPYSFSPAKELKVVSRITDKVKIEKICKDVINKNKKAVNDYKAGIEKALYFLVGKVMEATQRRADSKLVREIILNLIK